MGASLTYADAKHYFENVRGFTLIDESYVSSETPMRYICTCGQESLMSLKNARKGRNCKECGRNKLSAAKQVYTANFVSDYYREHGCELLDTFVPASTEKLKYRCVCGEIASMTWYKFRAGHRCQNCRTLKVAASRRKYTTAEVSRLFAESGKTLLSLEPFKNSVTPLTYLCSCGHESHITLNNFLRGKDCWNCRGSKISEALRDPNITDEERITKRHYPEYTAWRSAVYERDDYTCQCCGERGGKINAHHIRNYADNPEVRTSLENGVTLCEGCHGTFHMTYGYRNTNARQFEEFAREVVAA
jgi:5-methylcytosine-specific restriction endonuclease McrA